MIYLLIFIYFNFVNSSIVIAGKCSEGVIISSDSLFSQSGRIVSSREAVKVHNLTGDVLVCYVGGRGAEFSSLCLDLDGVILQERYHGDGNHADTCQCTELAHLTRRLVYSAYRSVHVIIVGRDISHDNNNNNADKYHLYEILPGGTIIDAPFIVAGSGAESVLGLLEEKLNVKTINNDNNKNDAYDGGLKALEDTITNAVKTAIRVDPRSGGVPRTYIFR